jgi:hypothetical protein
LRRFQARLTSSLTPAQAQRHRNQKGRSRGLFPYLNFFPYYLFFLPDFFLLAPFFFAAFFAGAFFPREPPPFLPALFFFAADFFLAAGFFWQQVFSLRLSLPQVSFFHRHRQRERRRNVPRKNRISNRAAAGRPEEIISADTRAR